MKNLRLLAVVFVTGSLIFTFSLSDAKTQGRGGNGTGQRQMLRDGSCAGSQKGYQATQGRGQVKGYGSGTGIRSMDGTGSGPGDGTHPKPMDGTGFGRGATK